jgi:sulfur carrier protein
MTITLNGSARRLAGPTTVTDVVALLAPADPGQGAPSEGGGRARGIAVAVNGAVVPRGSWATTPVRDGDAVEVLTAVQGG